MKKYQGFSLIEIAIVLIVLSILAFVAFINYNDYVKRTYVGEGISLVASSKSAVNDFFSLNGYRFPGTNASANLPVAASISSPNQNPVKSVEVTNGGVIIVRFGSYVDPNAILQFKPENNNGSITWICSGSGTMKSKWLPKSCR